MELNPFSKFIPDKSAVSKGPSPKAFAMANKVSFVGFVTPFSILLILPNAALIRSSSSS